MNEIKDIEAIFESANQAYSSFGDDLEDVLENAISLHRQVLDGLVSGHSGRYLVLENLGTLYIMQSTRGRLGGQDDIDYAMESFSEGIGLLPNGDDRQPQAFLNLARAHHAHFLLEKRRTSIDRAIAWYREVLKLGLDLETHTKVTCRLLLALALVQKHESASCLQSLIEAVAILRGLLSIPSVHIISLQRLADVLASHYKQLGGVCALAESETLSRKALSLCSPDDVSRGPLFASLGRSLLARIQHSGEERVNDLDEAIAFLNNAVQSRSSRVLSNVSLDLALLCARRYGLNHNSDDLDKAAELFERIIDDPTARPVDRISAASHWIMLSTTYDLQEMKTLAYTSTYHLIKRLYFFSPHLNIFLQGMRRDGITDLACDAAAYALQEEGPARALEILEYARGLMWGYGSRIGSPFEGLPMFQRSTRLIKTADLISGANVGAQLDQVFPLSEMQLRAAASRCRRLHAQFEEDLVQVCNEVPGFRHIFLETSASELMHVAERGPVVVLLASRIGCSAIVIKAPSSSPMHVLLPRVSIGGLRTLIGLFTRFRGRGSESHDFTEDTEFEDTDRHIQFSSRKVTYDDLLARLWKDIVSPVVTALGSQESGMSPCLDILLLSCPSPTESNWL
ncbi:hypothetical protein AcV5_010133 [Taiwanofungus camphoratus]|nr:hypothetical protein AcV5_010133 [Antrodia cinnamomea]